jgi:uncharacterized membrane protein
MNKIGKWYNRINGINPTFLTGALLVVITGIAAALRFYQIGKLSFWTDEISTMIYAKLSLGGLLQLWWKRDPNMDFYYLLVHYWYLLFPSANEAGLRAISAVFSIASIPVVYLLGKTLGANRKQATAIGLVAAFLITINAFHIEYGQELRSYSLVFLLAGLSTLLLIKAIEHPADSIYRWWLWYVLVVVVAVYSHLYTTLILMTQAISLLVLFIGNRQLFPFKRVLSSYLAVGILIVPEMIAVVKKGSGQISWVAEPTFNSVRNFGIKLAGNQGMPLLIVYLVLASVGLLIGILSVLHKDLISKWKFTLVVLCLLMPVATSLIFSKLVTPIFGPFYLIYTMQYLAILAAIGITALVTLGLKNENLGMVVLPTMVTVLGLMIVLSAMGINTYFTKYQKEDYRAVAQFIPKACPNGLWLYDVHFVEGNVTYYNPGLRPQVRIWSLSNGNYLDQNRTPEELAAFLPTNHNQVCLVLAPGHISSPQQKAAFNVIQTALQMKFPKLMVYKFQGNLEVDVYER